MFRAVSGSLVAGLSLGLGGCSVMQPVAETTVQAAVAQLPGSLARAEARRSCHEHAVAAHGQMSDAARDAALDAEIEAYLPLVEASLQYRAETWALVERIRATLDRREPIAGKALVELNAGLAEHLALRRALYDVAEAHECWLDAEGPAARWGPAQRLKGVMLSLSAALVLYDNYLLALSLYQDEPRLRMLLNNKDVGYGIDYGELNRVSLSFASEETRNRVRRGITYYEDARAPQAGGGAQDRHLEYLDQLIAQSPSYGMTRRFSPLAFLGQKVGFYVPFTMESLLRLKDEGVNMTSMLFGNSVGLVESRRGKLFGRPEVKDELATALQAGDILVERTPFRLTNSFIPGHWGHAALWIGGEGELRALGIWDDPVVQPHQDAIRSGRQVAEALRSGVELNALPGFLNVDDLVVLRPPAQTPQAKAAAILQALRQIGKRYDFNFDVETRDRLSCAELLYHAYADIAWPTRRQLGRAVIIPDDIVARALGEGPLVLVSLYEAGERVIESPERVLVERMAQRR